MSSLFKTIELTKPPSRFSVLHNIALETPIEIISASRRSWVRILHFPFTAEWLALSHNLIIGNMNPSTSWATTDLLVGLGPAGLDHCGVDPRIYWRFQLGVRRGLYKRVLSHLQGFQCLGGCCHPQTRRCFQGDQIQNSFCEKFTRTLIYFAADLFLPNSPSSSLHPNTKRQKYAVNCDQYSH
jgi:hypothetical protein